MLGENPLIPINEDIIEIENNLYLGNFETACNSEIMGKYKIKKILSVLQANIPEKYKIEGIEYKYVNLLDIETEDIISYFPECLEFIEKAHLNGENVYVHCRAGRSRSATIVIAFIMKKYGYTFEFTLNTVTLLRTEVNPNIGFQKQLKLWQNMKFVLLGSDPEYRLVIFSGLKSRLLIINRFGLSEDFNSCVEAINTAFICYIQKILNAENNCNSLNRGKAYFCKNCSHQLFEEINVIKNNDGPPVPTCASLYIEPQKWILKEIISNATSVKDIMNGEIKCLECKQILGTFDWYYSGYHCECETHKGLNFYLALKIDCNKLNE